MKGSWRRTVTGAAVLFAALTVLVRLLPPKRRIKQFAEEQK